MGMESFFVTIASKKMKKDISEPAYFTGYDEHMNIDWERQLKSIYRIKNVDDFLVINSIIEVHFEKTIDNSTYIWLCACLSCFDEGVKEMIDIIDNIEKIISDTPMVLICGDMYIYNKTEIEDIIREKYSEKKKNFERMFQSEKRICPYQFYTKGNSI